MPPQSRARAASAAAYLASRTRFGVKFGLETVRAMTRAQGHPELAYPTLLVAGTNGKGSVVAYVDAALRASGLRVGRYTSPHLVRVHERIVVDGDEISESGLEEAVAEVRRTAEALVRAGEIPAHPTYFEALTVAAFSHFRRERVDVAVLEVGMGARLDATNVCEPLASAIVSVDLDHEVYLGQTLAAIALEKAGVLRAGRATVLGRQRPEARRAIAERAAALGARLVDAGEGARVLGDEARLVIETPLARYEGLRALPGRHQRRNLLVALRLLEEVRGELALDLDALPAGLSKAYWPGRLEWVPGDPPLLLDGAHNPAGARALAAHLRGLRPFTLLFGVMRDKNVEALARILFPLADTLVLTRPRVGRAADPTEIVERAGGLADRARREADPRKALALARELARRGRPVVVAGSLYLVGEVKKALTRPS